MKIKKIFLLIIFFFQLSCGYKIANNIENYKFFITEYQIDGEREINILLEDNFRRFQQNEDLQKAYKLKTDSRIIKTTTSKNAAGDDLTYKIEIFIDVEVTKIDNSKNQISFNEETNYAAAQSKFELKQYEEILTRDLVNQIILEINNYLSTIQ
tara:strand:+ start:364 stop:825 length:462 start_codon:yes stop_codon:yes gene_type:complete